MKDYKLVIYTIINSAIPFMNHFQWTDQEAYGTSDVKTFDSVADACQWVKDEVDPSLHSMFFKGIRHAGKERLMALWNFAILGIDKLTPDSTDEFYEFFEARHLHSEAPPEVRIESRVAFYD